MSKKPLFVVVLVSLVCGAVLLFIRGFSDGEMLAGDNATSTEVSEMVARPSVAGENKHEHAEERELVSHPEKINLSVNDLLDEKDKTDKNKRILENHSNILYALDSYVYAEKNDSVDYDLLSLLLRTLIIDAHVYEGIQLSKIDEIDLFEGQFLNESDASFLSSWYISELNKYRERYLLISNRGDKGEIKYFSARLAQELQERKNNSNNFYRSMIFDYFQSDAYTMQQKYDFAMIFVEIKDIELANRAKRFLENNLGDDAEKGREFLNKLEFEMEEANFAIN